MATEHETEVGKTSDSEVVLRAALLIERVSRTDEAPDPKESSMSQSSNASDAVTAGAAGLAAWQAMGGFALLAGFGAFLAAIVAMCMMTPRSPKEWAVGLISTVISSLAGGSYVILKMGLIASVAQSPAPEQAYMVLMAGAGIVFACGLPGWAVVRWTFTWLRRREDRDLLEIANELRAAAGGFVSGAPLVAPPKQTEPTP